VEFDVLVLVLAHGGGRGVDGSLSLNRQSEHLGFDLKMFAMFDAWTCCVLAVLHEQHAVPVWANIISKIMVFFLFFFVFFCQ
jgi:hypothetical protein